jgi:hypothetical protein
MGAAPIADTICFMMLFVSRVAFGICVLAYAARCVPVFSFNRIADA